MVVAKQLACCHSLSYVAVVLGLIGTCTFGVLGWGGSYLRNRERYHGMGYVAVTSAQTDHASAGLDVDRRAGGHHGRVIVVLFPAGDT